MLGKGAKRKLDEDEEGLEDKALALVTAAASAVAPGCVGVGVGMGMGTLGPEGVSKGISYTLQRQTIFNISLMKLYSQRALSEPSLQRRVLINNMLRRIQDELKQEGALRPLLLPPVPPVNTPTENPLDDGFRQATATPTPAPVPAPVMSPPILAGVAAGGPLGATSPPSLLANGLSFQPAPQACLTPASLLEEDAGILGALPPPPAPSLVPPPSPMPLLPLYRPLRDSFSSALDEIEELCPSPVVAPTHTAASLSPSPLSLSPLSLSSACSSSSSSTSTTSSLASLSPPQSPALVPSLALSLPSDPKDCHSRKPGTNLADSGVIAMDTLPPPGDLDVSSTSSSSNSSPPSSGFGSSPSSCSSSSSSSSLSSSSGFLTDLALDDILFADIDTSMYDFDPCTSAAAGGASKLSPVVTADDLLKTLSSSSSSPTVTPNQPFKMDLTELDHIMEVLVGS